MKKRRRFKVGDTVRIIHNANCHQDWWGREGVVLSIESDRTKLRIQTPGAAVFDMRTEDLESSKNGLDVMLEMI